MLPFHRHRIFIFLSGLFCFVCRVNTCVSPTSSCECFEDNGKKIINCRYKNLTAVPAFIHTKQVYDEIRFTSFESTGDCQPTSGCNNITRLDANAFSNLEVRLIDLRNNPVEFIDTAAFAGLEPVLESLLLEGNGTNVMPYQALALLDIHLKQLHLENYGSMVLENPIVLPFPNLVSLTIKNWRNLVSINADIFNIMQNLKKIRLDTLNSLAVFPVRAIQKFRKIATIEIIETGVTRIEGDTFLPLSYLDEIKIQSDKYIVFWDRRAFNGVGDTVLYLDVSNNELFDIDFLRNENWTVLSQLHIEYNYRLKSLPTGIFSNMPALRYLDCRDTGLTQIDKSMFTGLSNLHTLDLSYNEITHISTGAFQNSPFLKDLRLNEQVTYDQQLKLQNDSFLGVESSLEVLDLMKNNLDLPQLWNNLQHLVNLKTLDLSYNEIRNIPNNAFKRNTELTTLVLAGNKLTSLHQDTFFGPRNLRELDLRGNDIRHIDECVFSEFSTKPTVILFWNLLVCDCELVWLYDWVKAQGNQALITEQIGTCSMPPALSNKYFNGFTRTEMCPRNQSAKTCTSLYRTDTSTTLPTTTITTTSTTTKQPLPLFELVILNVGQTSINVTWNITDKTFVTELKLEIISPNGNIRITYLGTDQGSYTFYQLKPDTVYTVCLVLKINVEFRDHAPHCKSTNTLRLGASVKPPNPGGVIG